MRYQTAPALTNVLRVLYLHGGKTAIVQHNAEMQGFLERAPSLEPSDTQLLSWHTSGGCNRHLFLVG